jgi:hypothetical protein
MKILYTGIGSKTDGIHTISEFLEIMKKEFTHRVWRFEYYSKRISLSTSI